MARRWTFSHRGVVAMKELTLEQISEYCAQLTSLVDEGSRSDPYSQRRAQELLEVLYSAPWTSAKFASPIHGETHITSIVVEAGRKIGHWFDPIPWANGGREMAGEQAHVRELIQWLELAALRNLTQPAPVR
jgi:hypothetical protein